MSEDNHTPGALALLPCPFCGAEPESNMYFAWCTGQDDNPHGLVQLGIDHWNERYPSIIAPARLSSAERPSAKFKHTPAPWAAFYKSKYDEWHVSLSLAGSSMKLALCPDGIQSENREADAHLIAAAPIMLSALDQHPDPSNFADADAYRNAANEWWDMFALPAIKATQALP